MEETKKTESTQETTKKKGPPILAIIGIGCLTLLVLLGITFTIVGKVLFSKFGASMVKKGIETKTGLNIDTDKNTVSFKDSKTGTEVNIGEQKIPENFPKDFPLYPKATPKGSIAGQDKETKEGYWLVLESDDSLEKVKTYYETNLPKSGWVIDNTMTINDSATWTVSKKDLSGTVMVVPVKETGKTTITIGLATNENQPASDNPEEQPSEEPSL